MLVVTCLLVILYFGICLDFSVSKVFISHVDEETSFSSDFKSLGFYFLIIIGLVLLNEIDIFKWLKNEYSQIEKI